MKDTTFENTDAAVAAAREAGAQVWRRGKRWVATLDGTPAYLAGGEAARRWEDMREEVAAQ